MGKMIVALLSYSAFTLGAATYTMSSPGEMADPDSWGGAIPGASDTAQLAAAGTYTATNDLSFYNLFISATGDGARLAFTNTPARKVTLASTADGDNAALRIVGNGASAKLDGGVWNLGGGHVNGSGANRHKNSSLVLSSGCVVTNAGTCYVGYSGDENAAMTLENSSKLYVNRVIVNGYANNTRTTLSILSGSTLMFGMNGSGSFDFDCGSYHNGYGQLASNKVVVSGSGSLLTTKGTGNISIGSRSEGHCLEVKDGGRIWLPGGNRIRIGMQSRGASYNRLVVGNNGTLETTGVIAVGDVNGTLGNILDVEPGGTLIATNGNIYVGSEKTSTASNATTGNVMRVRNATVRFKQICIGHSELSSGNKVYIGGKDSVFSCENFTLARCYLFGLGSNNEFVLDGATWNVNKSVGFGYLDFQGASNTVRLVNGASMTLDSISSFYVGGGSKAFGNEFLAGNGTTVSCAAFYVASHDNTAVISNGTVNCSQVTGGSFLVGVTTDDGSDKSGNSVILQGATPKISTAGRITFNNSARLRFEIPEGGYAEDHVPIAAGGLFELNDTKLELEAEAYRAAMPRSRRTFTLATSSGVSINASALASANAALPEDCEFFVDTTGKKLMLSVKTSNPHGMMLIFR